MMMLNEEVEMTNNSDNNSERVNNINFSVPKS